MDVKPGYKQSDAGIVPEDWGIRKVRDLALIATGAKNTQDKVEDGQYPFFVRSPVVERINSYSFDGEAVLTAGDGAGTGKIFHYVNGKFDVHQRVYRISNFCRELDGRFFYLYFSTHFYNRIMSMTAKSSVDSVRMEMIADMAIPLPAHSEQRAIAGALNDVDALIGTLDRLIAKKRQMKQGAMQVLLTGKRRLPGFSGEWQTKTIGEIAAPSPERNIAAENLPVLACSKHLGFVDSLVYFRNQVFSKDTSTYKVIRRGQIGYPANHVEEGSIGLQDLYDVALVSPIYVVFSVNEGVDSYFLHRLLKLDSYRREFKTATTSSVDRRGSLRWPAFSEITVNIPLPPEQSAIAAILKDMEAEIAALEEKLAKARQIKQGMMQELLTGRIRLL